MVAKEEIQRTMKPAKIEMIMKFKSVLYNVYYVNRNMENNSKKNQDYDHTIN